MSFRRSLRTLSTALLGAAFAVAPAHAQQFAQPTVIPTGNWPVAIYAADVNEDGHPDLIYIDYGATPAASTTHILLNNGDGTFRAGATLATAGSALAIGHFDSSPTDADPTHTVPDQHIDIGWVKVVGNNLSAVFAYGNGDGTFTGPVLGNITQVTPNPPVIVSLVPAPYVTGQADFLFAVDSANGPVVDVFYRLSFYSRPLTTSAGTLQPSDLNGDGMMDYIITSPTAGTSVFLGTTPPTIPPTFPLHSVTYGPAGVASSALADMDGDHHPDLITESSNGRLDIYHGNADGTFSSTSEIGTGASDGTTGNGGHVITVGDFNGDGILDIITSTPAGISVLLGTGNLNYKLGGIYNAGPGHTSFAFGDFNGDGHRDIAVDSPEGIAILFGNADGSFQTSRSYSAGQPAYSIALGRFQSTTIPVTGPVDAAVATGVPQFQVLSGDDKGGFSITTPPWPAGSPQTNSTRSLWSSVVQSDLDSDAILDLTVTKNGRPSAADTAGITLYYGNGDRTFTAPVVADPSGSQHIGSSSVATFNTDGVVHVLNVDTTACGSFAIASRTSTTPGTPFLSNTTGSPYNLVAPGYLTYGGASISKNDVVCELNGSLYIYKNNGSGGFLAPTVLPAPPGIVTPDATGALPAAGLFPSDLLFVDLDGDGFGDIIAIYHNLASDPAHPNAATPNQVYIYWGQADGSFSYQKTVITTDRNYYQAGVIPLDSGKQGLILSDGYMLDLVPIGSNRSLGVDQHYLAGMGINGIATYPVNGHNAIVVANGGAIFTNPAINRGTLAFNTDINTGGITVLLPADATPLPTPTGTVTALPEPSEYGHPFTLTAVVNGAPTPTGTVTFSIDGVAAGAAVTLDATGTATLAIPAPTYAVGMNHTLTAVYSGDTAYATATFTGTHTISLQPSQTYFTLLATPISYGQIIGDIAVVHADPLESPSFEDTTGGTITVYIDGVNTCVLQVTGTGGACPATTGAGYNSGSHFIYAVYSGNAFYASSTSAVSTVIVNADVTLAGTVTSNINPATLGSPVTFTAMFTAPFAVPNGLVTFYDGSSAGTYTLLGTGTLDAIGHASITTSTIPLGNHDITAVYLGNMNFSSATTPIYVQHIVPPPAATTLLLASSVNPSLLGQNVTFTAAVSTTVTSFDIPTGSITFTVDGIAAGSFPLNATGTTSFSTSSLPVGSHTIVASFAGSTTAAGDVLLPATGSLVQVVNVVPAGPSFTLTATPAAISATIGENTAILVTITPMNGFNQPVVLSCGSLPRAVTCTFANTILTPGSPSTNLQVYITGPHDCNSDVPYAAGGTTTWLGLLGASSLILLLRRRRRLFRIAQGITLSLALILLPSLTGCGQCTDLGVFPGNYTFTISGAATTNTVATSVNETETQTIKMVVHQ